MQRRASSWKGAGKALVGQTSRQAWQVPQVVGLRRVRRQFQRRQDRPQEQPRAELAADQVGVLALPAEAGALGQRLFQQGRGVDEHLQLAAEPALQPAGQRLQPALDQLVVVVALGVDADRRPVALSQHRQRVVVGAVVHPQHDRRAGVGPHGLGVGPARRGFGQPAHLAVPARIDEFGEPSAGGPSVGDRGEAAGVEAERQGFGADQVFGPIISESVRSRDRHSAWRA